MSSPFVAINEACGRYASLFNAWTALSHDLELLKNEEADEEAMPSFKAVRLTFVTQLDEFVPIDVPLSKKVLQLALGVISGQLGEATKELQALAVDANTKIVEAQCRKNPSSTTTPTTGSGSQ
jgi:hypothetical protein